MSTEQKITKIVDGDTPSIEASVKQLGSTGALAVSISDGSGDQITTFGGTPTYTTRIDKASDTVVYIGMQRLDRMSLMPYGKFQKLIKQIPQVLNTLMAIPTSIIFGPIGPV